MTAQSPTRPPADSTPRRHRLGHLLRLAGGGSVIVIGLLGWPGWQRSRDLQRLERAGAIFDTRKLGYKTVLVAMRFAADQLDAGAHKINEHPGVSHNYARVGNFNLWFTLAVPPGESLEDTISAMAKNIPHYNPLSRHTVFHNIFTNGNLGFVLIISFSH